jgi:hypothetical protein
MAHEDEVVKAEEEVESKLISEAQQRHEYAKTEFATDQEKKQAAVEEAHALSTRPDGSYAQLHEGEVPSLAVADKAYKAQLEKDEADAKKVLTGEQDTSKKTAEPSAAKK